MRVFDRVGIPALAVLIALTLSAPVLGGAAAGDRRAAVTIANFGQVNDRYYRGSQPVGDDYAELKSVGIRTIIDLTNEDDDNAAAASGSGFNYVRIPMSSTSAPTHAQLDQFLRIVNDPVNQPVYVHCKGGRHRTGTLTAAYRIANDGWTADRAYAEMLEYDFDYGFGHGGQKRFVFAYANELRNTVKP